MKPKSLMSVFWPMTKLEICGLLVRLRRGAVMRGSRLIVCVPKNEAALPVPPEAV
ncbi:MAG: hypothetical protein R2748_16945 [Bryobacterales bacterium]